MKIKILGLLILVLKISIIAAPVDEPFSVFITKKEIHRKKIFHLDPVILKSKLKTNPIISNDDIISYNYSNHTLELTRKAWRSFQKVGHGNIFIVCVGKEPIYWGLIWSFYSSVPFPGIVIVQKDIKEDYSIKIQLGYPNEGYFQGKDMRGDKRIIEALRKAGKLIE